MSHVCSRDNCGTKSVCGPSTKCVKCNKVCYLSCYGLEKCGDNGIKIKLNFDAHIAVEVKSFAFTCGQCDGVFLIDAVDEIYERITPKSNDASKLINQNVTQKPPSSHLQKIPIISEDIIEMKATLATVVKQMNALEEIKKVTSETNSKVRQIVNTSSVSNVFPGANTPSKNMNLAEIMKTQRAQHTAKRRLNAEPSTSTTESVTTPKPKPRISLPSKIGTRPVNSGLGIVAVQPRPKSKFDKSVYVSRINTSVTVDKMTAYISENTQLRAEDFRCTLLVKKDKDINTLFFVSYKIDVPAEKFDEIMNVDFWPEGVAIREFLPQARSTVALIDLIEPEDKNQHPSKLAKSASKNGLAEMTGQIRNSQSNELPQVTN